MEQTPLIFDIRPGTVDRGKDYEFKVAALLSLRCLLEGPENWWIASNVNGFGAFDDIVLRRGETTYLMQLHHQDNPKRRIKDGEFLDASKGHFSFAKCLQAIALIKDSVETGTEKSEIFRKLGRWENVYFVLYTNRESRECEFLENILDDDCLSVLNTGANIYRCDFKKCAIKALPDGFNLKAVHDCNFYFFSGQIHIQYVEDRITKIIEDILFRSNETKDVTKKFIGYVTDWARGDFCKNQNSANQDVNEKSKNFCLTKEVVISKLSELTFCQFQLDLGQKLHTYSSDGKTIWNKFIQDKTIVGVDSDKVVLDFLVENLGSEVKRYCQVHENEDWSYNLSDQEKTLFYQNHADLESQMFRVVGKSEKISLWDVYKCLWLANRVALPLEVRSFSNFERISVILNRLNPTHKIVLVNKSGAHLSSEKIANKENCFFTLQDLDEDHQKQILEKQIKLQGRPGTTLANLIDQNMFHLVKSTDIIRILLGNFNVGNELANLPDYYVHRGLSKVLFKNNFRKVKSDIFVLQSIEGKTSDAFDSNANVCKLEEIEIENISKYHTILTCGKVSWECEQIRKLRKANKPIHFFTFHGTNHLEWGGSFGSIGNIKRYQSKLEAFDVNVGFDNKITVVSAVSGMGKSIFIDYVARLAPIDHWVLRIDLIKHLQHYKYFNFKNIETEPFSYLNYFKNYLLEGYNTDLNHAIFEKLMTTKKILVLLDGFDEISVSFKKEVTEIAKCLHSSGFPLWLTTRPISKNHLEEHFNTFAVTLAPFSPDNQKEFLMKYFSTTNEDMVFSRERLEDFVVQLLKAFRMNINDRDCDFPSIPLHVEWLGDAFKDQCRRYLVTENQTKISEDFDSLGLYQKFENKKTDILCSKYGDGERDNRVLYSEIQCVLALKILFPLQNHLLRNIIKQLREYRREIDKLHILQKDGVVTVDENLKLHFIHHSFAGYFVARWLSKNFNSEVPSIKEVAQVLVKVRFNSNYRFTFHVFDCIVAKGCLLHLAIIEGRVHEAKQLLNSEPAIVDTVDKCGRSVLHVLALYCAQNPLLTNIFDLLDDYICKLASYNDVFGNNPLDYALGTRCLKISEVICVKWRNPKININVPPRFSIYYLEHCASMDYKCLFLFLLPHFLCKNLILSDIYKNKLVYLYFQQSFHCYDCLENIETVKNHLAGFSLETKTQDIFELTSLFDLIVLLRRNEGRQEERALENVRVRRRTRHSSEMSTFTNRENKVE